MFILHVALQGCLRGHDVEYGLTADTGGHIRYLLDLVDASAKDRDVSRIVIATRRFESDYGTCYSKAHEQVDDKIEIVRLATTLPHYLIKEDLHTETRSFAGELIAFIERQNVRPDMLHAHYADAAIIASLVEEQLGIPFVFTGHSLGRVKERAISLDAEGRRGLPERIAAEETAAARASAIIASSRDEAEVQYAFYDHYAPGRIRILPPGSDLARFSGASSTKAVRASIDRFLADPSKPQILALARPVRKKNLGALVKAFGENKALRRKANLVLIAGTRDDYADLDGDMAETVRDLLHLIDRYDLYGSVAYPKTHRPDDVPALYAYARERRGVFVNPALNEPFGLTLLEASAVGLPLVATDSGGPNDIVEMCRNGVLVDPRSPDAIAKACLSVLGDAELWDSYSAQGAVAVRAYDWDRHASRYHGLVRSLLNPKPGLSNPEQLLICDIDNTLVGCADSMRSFGEWRSGEDRLAFGIATGRSFHSAMAILEQQDAPRPQVMITSVGSEIYHLDPNGTTYSLDPKWRTIVSRGWDRAAAHAALGGLAGIHPQAPLEQRAHKLSYFTDGSPGIVKRVQARLEAAGLRCSVIHSHARYLDILPIRASKGTAVDFVRKHYGLTQDAVFVAGDSGNDIEMLRTIPQAIIVANFSDDLASVEGLGHSYVARQKYARGIIEGVLHFRNQSRMAACAQAS
ncbi:HAD-IIB family hydrolase [Mesorhizobium sp. RP14(2022)]|uniref:sucrose-phosphate synthase n=1 Tax=Mesorhizobium liriopis TaxID=2953882 RepID=A0ABT1C2K2_9HYPH|nr:HAD-IIB family hydrolase [Mesorhizobium liriopis]MCO6049044.1 HAD-IIB family hydrolase [Mesorhizobium liriopis]